MATDEKLLMDVAFLDELVDSLDTTPSATLLPLSDTLDFEDTLTGDKLPPVSTAFDQLGHETLEVTATDNLQVGLLGSDCGAHLRSKDAERRHMYRERQKEERDDLRRQVDELTIVLDDLKNDWVVPDGIHGQKKRRTNSLWKALSIQQKESQRIAVIHHRRLCEAVVAQAAIIKGLRGFIQQQLTESVLFPSRQTLKRTRLEPMSTVLFKTFVHQVD